MTKSKKSLGRFAAVRRYLRDKDASNSKPNQVYMRIITPDGNEMAKSYDDDYKFTFNKSRGYYAGKETLNYANVEITGVTYCEGQGAMVSGNYIIEVTCDGVVIGLLNSDDSIDVKRTAQLVEAAYPLGVTFHRAFDRCSNPFEALEQLIETGCERILTSGQKPAAPEGMQLFNELNREANDHIIIMPGSGVRKENIKMLAQETGCTEFHSSLRGKERSKMDFIHPSSIEPCRAGTLEATETKPRPRAAAACG